MDSDQDKKVNLRGLLTRIKSAWWLILLFAGISVLHFSSINGELNGLGGDNAFYVLLAKSLASFDGYRDLAPGFPLHTHFPPVFPLLLIPSIWIFGVNLISLHATVVLSELAALVLIFLLFRRLSDHVTALLTCLMFALNPFVNLSLVRILSEFPYILFTTAVILTAELLEDRKDSRTIPYLVLPLLVSLVYMTRVAGLSMLAAYGLFLLLKRRYRQLLIAFPVSVLPLIAWTITKKMAGTPPTSTGYIMKIFLRNRHDVSQGYLSAGDIIGRVFSNLNKMGHGLTDLVVPILKEPNFIIVIIVSGLVIYGLFLHFRKRKGTLLDVYVAVYLSMLVVWPIYEPRKLMVVAPFLFFYLFLAMNALSTMVTSRRRQPQAAEETQPAWRRNIAVAVIGGLLIIGQIPGTADVIKIRSKPVVFPKITDLNYKGFTMDWSHFREQYYWEKYGISARSIQSWADYIYLSHAAEEITPEGSGILARKPSITAFYSKRPTTFYPRVKEFEEHRRSILDNRIDYILIDGMFGDTRNYLIPYLQANSGAFRVVMKSGNAFLLKVNRDLL